MESDPYQELLREKGGMGFPYLVFLDAGGNVVARHEGPRSVEGFQASLQKAGDFYALKKKAEAGDPEARVDHFATCLELGHLKLDEARTKATELGSLTPEQTARIEGALTGLEVSAIVAKVRGREDMAVAGEKLAVMFKGGRIPTGGISRMFWSYLMGYASEKKDIPLFEEVVGRLEEKAGSDPMSKSLLDSAKKRLERLKEADDK